MAIREKLTKKTPLELACDERVRELMVVYSDGPYTLKNKDKDFLNLAIKGEKVTIQKQTIFNNERMTTAPKNMYESAPMNFSSNIGSNNYWKDRLVEVMIQLQEIGVKGFQHVKRPYLFTGSWMEGISNVEQLYDRISDITASEAMLRLFNILHPYEQPFPKAGGDEIAISNFYGEYYNFQNDKFKKEKDNSDIGKSVFDNTNTANIQSALDKSHRDNQTLQNKIKLLESDLNEYQGKFSILQSQTVDQSKGNIEIQKLKDNVATRDNTIKILKGQIEESKLKLAELDGKEATIEAISRDLHNVQVENSKLKQELNNNKKLLEVQMLTEAKSVIKTTFFSKKEMNKRERSEFVAKEMTVEQDAALQSMFNKLNGKPPKLKDRLIEEDKNKDQNINEYEFAQAMIKIGATNAELLSLKSI